MSNNYTEQLLQEKYKTHWNHAQTAEDRNLMTEFIILE